VGSSKDIKSDHDLLVEVITLLHIVKQRQENHLEHHRRKDIMMLSVTLGSIFTALIAIGSTLMAVLMK